MTLKVETTILHSTHLKGAATHAHLMTKAKELEAAFLSEMLGHAGLGDTADAPVGGIGESQFASFLRDAQARQMVERGGIGLAEQIFKSLTKGE